MVGETWPGDLRRPSLYDRSCRAIGTEGAGRMTTFRIIPRGPFSLEASSRFLEGFVPAAYEGSQVPLTTFTSPSPWRGGGTPWARVCASPARR